VPDSANSHLFLTTEPKIKIMKIAVLGTGVVGNVIATKLVKVGHQIMMGSRKANSDAGQEWLRRVGGKAQIGTFAEAATFGEIVFDCTNGANSLAALRQAGAVNLHAKTLIQLGNPLEFFEGIPLSLTVCNALDDSRALSTKRLFTPGVPGRLFVGATPLRDLYGRLPRDGRQRL
jgi:hypothetical protein